MTEQQVCVWIIMASFVVVLIVQLIRGRVFGNDFFHVWANRQNQLEKYWVLMFFETIIFGVVTWFLVRYGLGN